jgi:hypothetical protein
MAVKGQQVERAHLDMLYDIVADFPLRAVARYIGLPDEIMESLPQTQRDEEMYHELIKWVKVMVDYSPTSNYLTQAIFDAYLDIEGWQGKLERTWGSYLNELRGFAVVYVAPSLQAHIYRDLELIGLSFKDALILESRGGILPPWEKGVTRILEGCNSPQSYRRFLEVAILALTNDLLDDFSTIVHQLSDKEREAEYYSIGKRGSDFVVKLSQRIDRDRDIESKVNQPMDRLIYTLKRGGYRVLESREAVRGAGGAGLSDEAIQKRFERIREKVEKERSPGVSESRG